MLALTLAWLRLCTIELEHHMNGIWIAHPEYAAYATKVGIALGRTLFEITALISSENEHACSKAT